MKRRFNFQKIIKASGTGIILFSFIAITTFNRAKEMKPTATIQKLEKGAPVTIVALGDSLTYGWMAKKGYHTFLDEMLHEKYPKCRLSIINKGIPGDTASGGLSRLNDDVLKYNPDIVFIQFALNDAFTGYSLSQYTNNIQRIIDKINEKLNAEIILVTSIHLIDKRANQIANKFYDSLEQLARVNKLPIAMVHTYWNKKIKDGVQLKNLIQADRIHPNDRGYMLMAEAIMEVF